MASNSVRVDARLFDGAKSAGALWSRSAAQQVEHWAHIGAAVELLDLSVAQVAVLLRRNELDAVLAREVVPEAELWATKRARQARDIQALREGKLTNAQTSWFSGGRGKALKAINSPL
jgi:hypothetical protein